MFVDEFLCLFQVVGQLVGGSSRLSLDQPGEKGVQVLTKYGGTTTKCKRLNHRFIEKNLQEMRILTQKVEPVMLHSHRSLQRAFKGPFPIKGLCKLHRCTFKTRAFTQVVKIVFGLYIQTVWLLNARCKLNKLNFDQLGTQIW